MENPSLLPVERAFAEGDELWVLSESSGPLFHRVDWFLNFQLTKSIQHKTPTLPSRVTEILNRSELRSYDFIESEKETAWLIASSKQLPNRWVLLMKKTEGESLQAWWTSVQNKTKSLRAKSVRLFLPDSIEFKAISRLIHQDKAEFSTAVVPYQENTSWI